MRSEFEKWFKTSRSYLILKEANYYDLDLFEFNESYQRYVHSGIQIAFETYQHQQSKVDEIEHSYELLEDDYLKECKEKVELQKRVDALEKAEFKLAQVKSILQNKPKLLESILVKKIEQALNGGGE